MLIDARSVPAGTAIDTEVCIVGAGAAGITLAPEFVNSGVRVALLTGAAAWPCGATAQAMSLDRSLRQSLLALFEEPWRLQALGEACLKALPAGQNSPERLEAEIAAAVGAEASALRRRLAARVRRDLADGAIVNVDGWRLSSTETRLYALLARMPDGTA